MSVNIAQAEDTVKVQVSVPVELWRKARSQAALAGQTNGELLTEALEAYLAKKEQAA